ncbi:hypothetical protein EUX98_g224 [Antrodiella citrinella]|uniref:DH domain-containing protein n=1 Tax=Antrodiella citrinella TaxID=2447956 RepID=A0A4S4N4H5_9APHY|nr:hypothetical protein EUX98_g224 [Antrodiella citrinella]
MKAFLNRFNRGLSSSKDKDRQEKEKIPPLPPLQTWPPQSQQQHRVSSTPSFSSFKPLPDISVRPLPPIEEPQSDTPESSATPTPVTTPVSLPSSPQYPFTKHELPVHPPSPPPPPQIVQTRSGQSTAEPDSAGRSSRKTASGSASTTLGGSDVQKKVAFISPPPTPGPQPGNLPPSDTPSGGAPNKTTVSRFQAKETRGSTSTATSSKTDVASTLKTAKPASTRATTSPFPKNYGDGASLHQSLRSGTPYSQMTNGSRILGAQSWSEQAEEDLVSNIGQRERTRQEVLWEILASEERYVSELLKLKETFIEALLHPYSTSPVSSPVMMEYEEFPRADSPRESVDHLPIAARFLSPLGFRSDSPAAAPSIRRDDEHKDTPNIDGESLNSDEEEEAEDRMGKGYNSRKTAGMSQAAKHNHPRSPYGTTAARKPGGKSGITVPFPSRSHQSLPPPPRANPHSASTHSLGRQSFIETNGNGKPTSIAPSSRVLRKFRKSNPTAPDGMLLDGAVSPNQLPEDLKKCLEVIEGGILDGHIKLAEGLRKRYDEQYPLVRSLADVFVMNSHILHGYATYVLHLERALEQVDNALATANGTKKPTHKKDAEQWIKISQHLGRLEQLACDKGETGLAISLSKPFQRLLKYPLLFQNLLFHTDPSTYEYESTLQMVAEVETIVRSIEDEKIQKEERDKTRDVFARIEGLDKVKQLMVPKPSRILVEERPAMALPSNGESSKGFSSPPVSSQNPKNVKGKSSLKRLSDVLQNNSNGVGGKKDQWLVVFNDVVLRCQRTGTTSLPLSAATNSRAASLPELQGKAKYATTGRRNTQTKPRNLYKFLKIETWAIGDVVQPREGVVSMEDVVRSRQQVHSGIHQPRIVPLPDDDEDGGESDDSDKKSKMSFSYWGADKVTLQKPIVKPRQMSATPTARRTATHSDEGHSAAVKVTVTRSDRPAWNDSTRAVITPTQKRARNVSQTSAVTATKTSAVVAGKLSSPAPSEDSGVGFYRNLIAQDPSLNQLRSTPVPQ